MTDTTTTALAAANPLTTLEGKFLSWIETTEQDVLYWCAQIKAGIQLAEQYVQWGLEWVAKNAGSWVSSLQNLQMLLSAIPGFSTPATITALITDAISGLQAVAAAQTAGQTTGQTLLSAYGAIANAKAANAAMAQALTAAKAA